MKRFGMIVLGAAATAAFVALASHGSHEWFIHLLGRASWDS